MEEDVTPQLIQLPIDKIPTKTYSLTIEVPVEEYKNERNVPISLVFAVEKMITEKWHEATPSYNLKHLSSIFRHSLVSFFQNSLTKLNDTNKPTLAIKYTSQTEDIEIALMDGVTGEIASSYYTKCIRMTCQKPDLDGNVLLTVLTVYKHTLEADDISKSWYSSGSKPLHINYEALNNVVSSATPVTTSSDSFESLSIKADEMDYRLVPKYINKLKFVESSEPRLVLGDFEVIFKVNNTREVGLAKMLFQKDEESLYDLIEYDELNEYFSGSEEEWFSMNDGEKKKFKDEMERASRQLGNRIAKMIGSAECVISAEKYGLRIKSEFLKPKE